MKLCLNMIVKNEAERIERCLAAVAPWISSYAIIDTGSTDGTDSKIMDYLATRRISGVVTYEPFINFGDARNRALALARGDDEVDYFFLVDADMELKVENNRWIEEIKTANAYRMKQQNSGLSYSNVRLLRRGCTEACYVGATHEYLSVEGEIGDITGAWFHDHADGANRENKFTRDIELLEADLAKDPNNGRAWYYMGQSYRDLGNRLKAVECYQQAITTIGWDENAWHAHLCYARCLRDV